jgi:PAS domain S-box-containing protein
MHAPFLVRDKLHEKRMKVQDRERRSVTDKDKTKEQLLAELETLRAQLREEKEKAETRAFFERDFSKSVEMFRTLFTESPDSVFLMEMVKGEGPVIMDANPSACRMHGYEKHELIGRPIRTLDSPAMAEYIAERARRLLAGEALHFQGEHVRKDGTVFPVEVWARLITIGGRSYMLGIDRDITKRNEAEARLAGLGGELESILDHLEGISGDGLDEKSRKHLAEAAERTSRLLSSVRNPP